MRSTAPLLACFVFLSPAFAAVTAYVPTCCSSPSTVSVISTAQNRVSAGFSAGSGAYSIAFAPDGNTAWVADAVGNALTVLSLPSYSVVGSFALPLQPWLVKVSPDGKTVYVIVGNFHGHLDTWPAYLIGIDVKTNAVTLNVAIPNHGVAWTGLAISPDSNRVYATLDTSTIIVCDIPSHSLVATWGVVGPELWTTSGTLTLSPDGHVLYTAGQVLTALDTATGNPLGTVVPPGFPSEYSFAGSAVSTNGSTLYATFADTVGAGGGVAVIDTATLTETQSLSFGGELQQPVLTKDDATLYVPDAVDSLVYALDASTFSISGSIALKGAIATATLGPQGRSLYVPNQSTSGLMAVDPSTLRVIAQNTIASGPTSAVSAMNGARVFVAGYNSNSVSEINTRLNLVTQSFTVGDFSDSVSGYNPTLVTATPDGSQLYIGTSNDQFYFVEIDVATGVANGISCPYGYCDAVSIAVAPNGEKVYIDGYINDFEGPIPPFLLVVDTASKRIVHRMRLPAVGAMAVAPSGSYLYLSDGASLRIYDTASDTFTGSIPAPGITSIAFTPDGSEAYCSAGQAVLVINTASQAVTASVSLASATAGPISTSPDGTQAWVVLSNGSSIAVIETSNNTFRTLNLGVSVNGVAFGVK